MKELTLEMNIEPKTGDIQGYVKDLEDVYMDRKKLRQYHTMRTLLPKEISNVTQTAENTHFSYQHVQRSVSLQAKA